MQRTEGTKQHQLTATSGPNREPRSPNLESIGCRSVRHSVRWSSFLSLRTVVRSEAKLRTVLTMSLLVSLRAGRVGRTIQVLNSARQNATTRIDPAPRASPVGSPRHGPPASPSHWAQADATPGRR
jgi:hypothetical protein